MGAPHAAFLPRRDHQGGAHLGLTSVARGGIERRATLRGRLGVFVGGILEPGPSERRAAVRAPDHLARVGRVANGAKAERTRLSMLQPRELAHVAEHQLLGADANPIAVVKFGQPLDEAAVDAATVAAAEVFEHGLVVVDRDARVAPRNGRIEDGDVAIGPATDERLPGGEIELLKQEAQPILRSSVGLDGVHRVWLRCFLGANPGGESPTLVSERRCLRGGC